MFPGEIFFTSAHQHGCQALAIAPRRRAASSTAALQECRLWIGSGEGSGADILNLTAEDKPEHLGIHLLEQGTQGSFSERREIPNVRSSGTERCYPSLASSQGVTAPWAVCSHHKQAAGSKLLTVCTGRVERAAGTQHTGAQRGYGVSWPPNVGS